LTVSGHTIVRKVRQLPIKGEVLVKTGDHVKPDAIVAVARLPGLIVTVKATEQLGIEPKEIGNYLQVKIGDPVTKGQVLAESKGFMGLFKSTVVSPVDGTYETLFTISGHIGIREPPIPINKTAYMSGRVVEILEGEGAIVEAEGALVQGIFGVGGERYGELIIAVEGPAVVLTEEHFKPEHKDKIVVGGAGITSKGIKKAVEVGAIGILCGGVKDSDLIEFLGFDIGVAITGQEKIPLTLIVTEGFGDLAMAERTFKLFKSLEGKQASMNGATQIRAGVIRPEVVVPLADSSAEPEPPGDQTLDAGTHIRIIREPYFGALATVTNLPHELHVIESGAEVRVLDATLATGEKVTVPRANVEIIAE